MDVKIDGSSCSERAVRAVQVGRGAACCADGQNVANTCSLVGSVIVAIASQKTITRFSIFVRAEQHLISD